jgi:hypothetical protein
MTVPTEGAPPEGTPAPPTPPEGVQLSPEQQAVLKEHGINVPDDGKIAVTDHLKLLNTLSNLRQQARTAEQQAEATRVAALSDVERQIEAAKVAGRTEAESTMKTQLVKAQVEAKAAAANFQDPADAHGFIADLSALDTEEAVAKAVADLATNKPYLLKRNAPPPKLEGGKQGGNASNEGENGPNAWLRGALTR